MNQLYRQFKDTSSQKQPVPLSPKSIQRTPMSNRKKKAKLVLRGDVPPTQQQTGTTGVAGVKNERFVARTDEASANESQQKKESVKHRELKNMIRQNKHINNLNVSSFVSQEREEDLH